MSYVILSIQYKRNIIEKIENFLITNYNQESVEFNKKLKCYVEDGYDTATQKVFTGIDEELKCMGYDFDSHDECDFELEDLTIMDLSTVIDQLLEGNFKLLETTT